MSHLKDMKENYFVHLFEALNIVLHLLKASIACLIHAFVPFIFKTTASSTIKKVIERVDSRNDR